VSKKTGRGRVNLGERINPCQKRGSRDKVNSWKKELETFGGDCALWIGPMKKPRSKV